MMMMMMMMIIIIISSSSSSSSSSVISAAQRSSWSWESAVKGPRIRSPCGRRTADSHMRFPD